MIERTVPPIEPLSADDVAQAAEAPALAKRPPGRPKGTDYRSVDAPLHERMRQLLKDGVVHSRTAAAKRVVGMAYGHGCEDSKIRRLVQSFLY
jgi:hypothetical protein